ncbi:MAG: phosphatidylglycerol lysyltransferase domain-containing protein [Peptostreptococcaceae bacterium]
MKSFFRILFNSLKDKKFKNLREMIKEYDLFSNITNIVLAVLVFVSGIVLIVSAIYPPAADRIKFMQEILSIPFLQFSHRVSLLIGLILLMVAKEIFYKVKRSYYFTILLLALGCIFTFLKGFDYEEAIFVLGVIVLLRLAKKSFYRKSIPIKLVSYTWISLLIIVMITVIFSFVYKFKHDLIHLHKYNYYIDLFHSNEHYYQVAIFTYISFVMFLILWYITSEKIEKDSLYNNGVDTDMVSEFLGNSNCGDALTHLVYLGDKNIFWALDGKAMIIYSKFKDKIFVLGNPVVERENLSSCIQEFQQFLDLYGYKPTFFQIDENNLPIYHDNGYYFFKLGEEAVVDLEEFNLVGSKKSSFRNTLRRFEKEGYCFEVVNQPFNKDFLDELKVISKEWLGSKKEKGFSMGWFDEEYLQKAPIAIVKNKNNNEIIAFISIMYNYDGESVSIDLMRHKKEIPNSTMEYIILNSILYFKEAGYKKFNLGEAPLSNVGFNQNSHNQEKIARLVYNYGQVFYSFTGLRKFKQKFGPNWEPRYLAYSNFMKLPEILLDSSRMVSVSKDNNFIKNKN